MKVIQANLGIAILSPTHLMSQLLRYLRRLLNIGFTKKNSMHKKMKELHERWFNEFYPIKILDTLMQEM